MIKLLYLVMYTKKNVFSTPLNFVKSNLMRMFVSTNIMRGGEVRKTMWAIFVSARKHIRFHIPVPNYNGTAAFEVLCNGLVWNRSFFHKTNFLIEMTNTIKNCLSGNNSTQQTASAHETGFSYFKAINFVKSNLMRMFAVHNILEGGEVRKFMWAIFVSARKHIRFHIPVPNYNGTAAFEVLCNGLVWNRSFFHKTNFLIEMHNTIKNCLSGNNSTQQTTSSHETGFQRLSSLIPNLHEAHIRYKKNRVTGVFNISGRKTTMGATSLPELIEKLLQKEAEYREYIRQNRKKKHNEK